jgi:hypothetical protein
MLKTVLESLDGVDDAVKPFYAETDGKFVLQVEGVDDHPEVANLRNAYTRTKADREAAKTEASALKAKIAELEKGAPDTAATQAKITALQEQLAAKEAEAGEWRGKYTGVTRDQSLSSALQGVGITEPAFIKAATAMLSGEVKLGEDGTAYVETAMGPKMLGDFVKAWASGDGKAFVTKPQGGGAQPATGSGGKTISASQLDTMTPQEKAAFYKANPGVKVV